MHTSAGGSQAWFIVFSLLFKVMLNDQIGDEELVAVFGHVGSKRAEHGAL